MTAGRSQTTPVCGDTIAAKGLTYQELLVKWRLHNAPPYNALSLTSLSGIRIDMSMLGPIKIEPT